MQSPLEVLFAGALALPEPGGTVAEGRGELAPPTNMAADWAEKFTGPRHMGGGGAPGLGQSVTGASGTAVHSARWRASRARRWRDQSR